MLVVTWNHLKGTKKTFKGHHCACGHCVGQFCIRHSLSWIYFDKIPLPTPSHNTDVFIRDTEIKILKYYFSKYYIQNCFVIQFWFWYIRLCCFTCKLAWENNTRGTAVLFANSNLYNKFLQHLQKKFIKKIIVWK